MGKGGNAGNFRLRAVRPAKVSRSGRRPALRLGNYQFLTQNSQLVAVSVALVPVTPP
jgi:hypothetical protein